MQKKAKIRIGFTYDYSPFSFIENGKHIGIDVDLSKELAKKLNFEILEIKTSWISLHEDFKNNIFDLGITGIAKTKHREEFAYFSTSYFNGGKTAISREEDVNKLNTLEKINNKNIKIVVNKGGTNELYVKRNFPNAQIHYENDNNNVFERIKDKTVDLMITDSIEAEYMENKNCGLKRTMPNILLDKFEICIMLPQDKILKDKINKVMNELENNGFIKQTISKYLD